MLNSKAKEFVPSFLSSNSSTPSSISTSTSSTPSFSSSSTPSFSSSLSTPSSSYSRSPSPPNFTYDSPLSNSPTFLPQELDHSHIQDMIRSDTLIPFREDEEYIDYEIGFKNDHSISSISVKRWLTVDQLYTAKAGYGGRVGILAYVVDSNGNKNYLLNISNRQLYSDFGGGFSSKNAPYDGLIRELKQETPQWSEYFLDKLDDPETKLYIYSTENIIATKTQLRLDIMIVMEVDPSIIKEFVPTKEVLELVIANDQKMRELFRDGRKINNGLRLIRSIYDDLH